MSIISSVFAEWWNLSPFFILCFIASAIAYNAKPGIGKVVAMIVTALLGYIAFVSMLS